MGHPVMRGTEKNKRLNLRRKFEPADVVVLESGDDTRVLVALLSWR